MSLTLRPLRVDDEHAALAAHAELAADDFVFLLHWPDDREPGMRWGAYLAELERIGSGAAVDEGWMPSDFLVAESGGEIVGRVSIRYRLNEWLAEHGGHVGYGVRPAFRRRGYATEILRGALDRARDAGLDRVLVTCAPDNAGSAAVIERCGGVFERLSVPDEKNGPMRRYWIDLG